MMTKSRYNILEKNDKFFIKKEMKFFNLFTISYFLRKNDSWVASLIFMLLFFVYFTLINISPFPLLLLIGLVVLSIQVFIYFEFLNTKILTGTLFKKKSENRYSSAKYNITRIYERREEKKERKRIAKKIKDEKKLASKNKYKLRGIISENSEIEEEDLKKYMHKENRKTVLNKVI